MGVEQIGQTHSPQQEDKYNGTTPTILKTIAKINNMSPAHKYSICLRAHIIPAYHQPILRAQVVRMSGNDTDVAPNTRAAESGKHSAPGISWMLRHRSMAVNDENNSLNRLHNTDVIK